MTAFAVAQARANQALEEALERVKQAHELEVQDLKLRLDDLTECLSRIPSCSVDEKTNANTFPPLQQDKYEENNDTFFEMRDDFSNMPEDVHGSLFESRDFFQDTAESGAGSHASGASNEEVSRRRRNSARLSHDDPEARAEAVRITQQVLALLPPAQRRAKKQEMLQMGGAKSSRLQRMVESPIFESCCALLIVLNSILVGLDVEWYTTHDTPDLGIEIAGHICSAWFLLELVLRLKAYRCAFFRGDAMFWNMFDLLLVFMSLVEVVMLVSNTSVGHASIGSGMKTIKMLRIIRVFRVFRFFKELSLLALMIIDSMKALIWAMVMLTIILYVFAICFTVNATEHVKKVNQYQDPSAAEVYRLFGSIGKTVYSLLQAMLGGVSWGVMSDALFNVGWPLAALFFFYVSFTMLAVLNIITGVFVDNAVETAKTQRDVLVQKEFDLKEKYLAEMRELFIEMDDDRSGTVTLQEIKEYFSDPRVMSYFQVLGIDPNDTEKLFRLIDDDDSGDVNVEEFLLGCMRLKGGARSIDVHQLLHEVKRLELSFERLAQQVTDISSRVKTKRPVIVHSY